jgi:hypothetical protein
MTVTWRLVPMSQSRPMNSLTALLTVALVALAGCGQSTDSASPPPSASATPAVTLPPTPDPTSGPTLDPEETVDPSPPDEEPQFLSGVVDVRPDGWFFQTNSQQTDFSELIGFPRTIGQVYGPADITLPPFEGPGRLALYETFPVSDAYLDFRIGLSRERGGSPVAVNVNGEPAEVWRVPSTGELLVGWTIRGKSEVLVANAVDFTVAELVDSAESVTDCCG